MESKSKKEWSDKTLSPLQSRFLERKSGFYTASGIEIDSLYTEEDLNASDVEFPGEYPFTRGVQPNMYRGRLWTMRQYAGMASPEAVSYTHLTLPTTPYV